MRLRPDLRALAGLQGPEAGLPGGGKAHGDPGRLDESGAQLAASLLGDAPGAGGLPRGIEAGAQTGIADEGLGGGKAADIPNGAEDGHGRDQPHAGHLH